jgi:RimJ/RimL family protein N-acetyltransferase
MRKIEMTLEGEKVWLRPIREEDAELIVKWRSDPRVYGQLFDTRPLTPERHMNWYRACYLADASRTDFIMIEKESGRPAGTAGLKLGGVPEVSYAVGEADMTGRGLAKDAVLALLRYVRGLGADSAEARIREGNAASVSLAEGLGFVYDRALPGGVPASVYKVRL